MSVRLYIWQRMTALILAPLVIGHLVVIFYATSRGLTATDILGRTQGSIGWALYYSLFVLAASIHGAIGVRQIAIEWGGVRGPAVDVLMFLFGGLLFLLGLRAVVAVVLP